MKIFDKLKLNKRAIALRYLITLVMVLLSIVLFYVIARRMLS